MPPQAEQVTEWVEALDYIHGATILPEMHVRLRTLRDALMQGQEAYQMPSGVIGFVELFGTEPVLIIPLPESRSEHE